MNSPAPAFVCRQCGECCLGRGGVRFTDEEMAAAASYLKISQDEFKRLYLTGNGPLWEIGTDSAGYCHFHRPGGLCLVHPVKPAVCRLWPYLPGSLRHESAFIAAKAACPGLRRDLTWAEFKAEASR